MIDKSLCKSIPKNSKKVFGSGGSRTVIVITPNQKIYKYFINFQNVDTNINKISKENIKYYKNEINIQKYLTKNIVDNNLSPHIVKLEDMMECKNAPSFFFKKCISYKKYILTKNNIKKPIPKECFYLLHGHPVILKKGFLIAEMEYCPIGLGDIIYQSLRKSNKTLKKIFDRILFQLIFTLSVIQKKYPYFVHHDFFMRNILATELKAEKDTYIRYKYGKYTFDLPANGYMCKITDFGYSNVNKSMHESPLLVKSPHEDVFNILYDIYDGGNLGAKSSLTIAKKRKNKMKMRFIKKYFSQFFNTKIMDTIQKKGKKHILNWDWRKFYDPQMSKLLKVKHPYEYLKYFTKIYPMKSDHTIIQSYGL